MTPDDLRELIRRERAKIGAPLALREPAIFLPPRDTLPRMKIHAPRDLAEAVAALLDLLAQNVPEIAAECVAFADRLRAWAGGVTVDAGPEKPPPPPPPPNG